MSMNKADWLAVCLAAAGVALSIFLMATGSYGGLLSDVAGILSFAGFAIALFGFLGRMDKIRKGERDE